MKGQTRRHDHSNDFKNGSTSDLHPGTPATTGYIGCRKRLAVPEPKSSSHRRCYGLERGFRPPVDMSADSRLMSRNTSPSIPAVASLASSWRMQANLPSCTSWRQMATQMRCWNLLTDQPYFRAMASTDSCLFWVKSFCFHRESS